MVLENIPGQPSEDQAMIDYCGDFRVPFVPAAEEKPALKSTLPPISSFRSLTNEDDGRIAAEFNLKSGDTIKLDLTDVTLLAQSMPADIAPVLEVALKAIEADKPAQDQIMREMPYRLAQASVC